jgi:hypothetical protein
MTHYFVWYCDDESVNDNHNDLHGLWLEKRTNEHTIMNDNNLPH